MFCIFVIREIRKQKGVSLVKLAQMTNICRAYISELEANKKTNPTFSVLYKIANALDVNVKDLFYTSDDMDYLKKKLDETIDEHGLHSLQVAQISKTIDTLITLELQEKNFKNNITDEHSDE